MTRAHNTVLGKNPHLCFPVTVIISAQSISDVGHQVYTDSPRGTQKKETGCSDREAISERPTSCKVTVKPSHKHHHLFKKQKLLCR